MNISSTLNISPRVVAEQGRLCVGPHRVVFTKPAEFSMQCGVYDPEECRWGQAIVRAAQDAALAQATLFARREGWKEECPYHHEYHPYVGALPACLTTAEEFVGCCAAEAGYVTLCVALKGELNIAGWSSLVARRAHNPKVVGSNPAPATKNSRRPVTARGGWSASLLHT